MLPQGHNVTTTICVNWKDQAIFTFVVEANLTLKSAVLAVADLENSNKQMNWVLNMSLETHEIDRLHIKAAATLPDGRIALMARGRNPKLFSEDVSGFILYFAV